jgi:hypothetical protein
MVSTSDSIHCRPERKDSHGKPIPSRFDTALINDGTGEDIGLEGTSFALIFCHNIRSFSRKSGYHIGRILGLSSQFPSAPFLSCLLTVPRFQNILHMSNGIPLFAIAQNPITSCTRFHRRRIETGHTYSKGQNCFNVLNVCNKTRITWEPSKLES